MAVDELADLGRYEGTPGAPKAFLVDLDGTVALNGVSRDNPNRGWFEWHRVGEDLPNKPVIDIVKRFIDSGLQPVFVSGRENLCYWESLSWIHKHVFDNCFFEVPLHDAVDLLMRGEGDYRQDSIIKLEIFDNHIRDYYDVQFCLDDRNQVVAAYRSIGLTVLQVAPGDF